MGDCQVAEHRLDLERAVSQTRLGSFIESWTNIAIGFGINFTANLLILPLFGFHSLTLGKNFEIGLLYTLISLCRSFFVRRLFNRMRAFNVASNR